MDILHLIDRLEELFNESRALPFTHNVVVDEDRMLDIIDQMRIAIPEEVKKAQQLLNQSERILAQAQEKANRALALAQEKADQMAAKDVVTQEAQRRAEQIINQARADAEATRNDADDYVAETLMRVEAELQRLLKQVHNGIRTLEEDRMLRSTTSTEILPE
ncbi:MAG: ATP synthase F0 subunit B [Chloroflexi bacterium]|nr:ATP synthase F0 subunit B [Chloroflexota bacterium]